MHDLSACMHDLYVWSVCICVYVIHTHTHTYISHNRCASIHIYSNIYIRYEIRMRLFSILQIFRLCPLTQHSYVTSTTHDLVWPYSFLPTVRTLQVWFQLQFRTLRRWGIYMCCVCVKIHNAYPCLEEVYVCMYVCVCVFYMKTCMYAHFCMRT